MNWEVSFCIFWKSLWKIDVNSLKVWKNSLVNSVCYCSVANSYPTLFDPMDWSMPGFPVLHYLPPGVCSSSCPLSQWCRLTISFFVIPFSCPQSFPASGSFLMTQLFASGGQSIEASASVLPMNILDWFPLGLTGLISLLSKGLFKSLLQHLSSKASILQQLVLDFSFGKFFSY